MTDDTTHQAIRVPVEAPVQPPVPSDDAGNANLPPMLSLLRYGMQTGMDTDAMQKLMDIAQSQENRQAEREYATAMTQVQGAIPPVLRDRENVQTRSNYATPEAIHRAIYPVYSAHGFSVSFGEDTCPHDGLFRTVADVFHAGGHSKHYYLDLPVDDKGIKGTTNKTPIQAKVSSITYARRALESMIFNVVTTDTRDDDDGNNPLETITPEQAADLEALCAEVGADRERFLKWLGVENFDTLPAGKHAQAVKGLEAKRRAS